MKKREQGVLTIEASIVLTLTLFVILFLFSFARVYSAQSMVSHAVLQSSDAMAMESYLREASFNGDTQDVVKLASKITGISSVTDDAFTSLRSASIPVIAREKFITAVSNTETNADKILKALGVKDGVSGVDFSSSRIDLDKNEVIVFANYTIKMQFPIFGMKEIDVTKAAKAKTFGEILFEVSVYSQDPRMGSATGGGNFKHGTDIEISATPNYGYKFKCWTDGNTDNPRIVKVSGAAEYVAVFEADSFGVNVFSNPSDGGNLSGAGTYKYQSAVTVKATPALGYSFNRWAIYGHKDGKTKIVRDASATVNVDQTYSCTAYFTPNTYTVKVKTEGISGGASITYKGSQRTTVSAVYKESFVLNAPTLDGYRFLGWKEEGSGSYFSTSPTVSMTVQPKNVTYVACYKNVIYTVRFLGHDGEEVARRTVQEGKSLGGNMPGNPSKIGKIFDGWRNFSGSTRVYGNTDVQSNWRGCSGHVDARCGIDHPVNMVLTHAGGVKYRIYTVQCIVCYHCGIPKYGYNSAGKLVDNWNGTLGYNYGSNMPITRGIYCFYHPGCRNKWNGVPIKNIH